MDIEKVVKYLQAIDGGYDTIKKMDEHQNPGKYGTSLTYNLKKLQKLRLITRHEQNGTRPYSLTEKGEKYLELMG
jgi:DNA-binding PadR family transcriptional regulator